MQTRKYKLVFRLIAGNDEDNYQHCIEYIVDTEGGNYGWHQS